MCEAVFRTIQYVPLLYQERVRAQLLTKSTLPKLTSGCSQHTHISYTRVLSDPSTSCQRTQQSAIRGAHDLQVCCIYRDAPSPVLTFNLFTGLATDDVDMNAVGDRVRPCPTSSYVEEPLIEHGKQVFSNGAVPS